MRQRESYSSYEYAKVLAESIFMDAVDESFLPEMCMDSIFSGPVNNNGGIGAQWPPEQGVTNADVERPAQIDDNRNGKVDTKLSTPLTKNGKVSKAWAIFDKVKSEDGRDWAICRHCKKKYTASSKKAGTSNLLKHMENCPGRRNGEGDKPVDDDIGGTATPVLNREKTMFDQERSCMSMARMIIKHRYPLSTIEKDFLEKFENNLQSTFKPQTHSSFKAIVLDVYKEERDKLLTSFNETSSGRSNLTINLWRRDAHTVNCCLTLQFIDDGWELKNKVLAFKRVAYADSYWKLFGSFKSMLLDWSDIGKNVCTVTAQHTKETDETVSEIKHWLVDQGSLPMSGRLSHVYCFVHILNLLIEDGLQKVIDVLFHIMKCISYVHDTPEHYKTFRTAVALAIAYDKKVTSEDMSASWIYNFQILEKVLGLREAFSMLKIIDQNFVSLNPEEEEWDKATHIYDHLKVLDEALRSFSEGRSCLTTNAYFPKVCNIYRNLCKWAKSDNVDVQSMAYKMKDRFDKYWNNCSWVLAIAVVLDPRFKFDIVEHWFKEIFGHDAENHCTRIRDTFAEVYKEYASGSNNSAPSSTSKSHITGHFDMLDHLGMECTSTNHDEDGNSQKSQLERYLEEPKFRSVKDFDILGWWRVNTPNFPTLAKMARDFLAIPIAAAQSNPSFNDDVMKIDPISIGLDYEVVEAFICVKDWLQLPKKK